MSSETCRICPHNCKLGISFCGGRDAYGKISAIALDPIEKKPLRRFHPGKLILSVGSFGCNFRCGFCQNHHISSSDLSSCRDKTYTYISPDELAEKAAKLVPDGNIGVAFTYNEPLINFEYVLDSAKIIRAENMKNVLVTNGFINPEPLSEILPFIDAMNIDLKAFTADFYKKICGDLETVKSTIVAANRSCHVEISTLIIPGENDSDEEITAIAKWISSVDKDIPWHISRYFPRHEYTVPATEPATIYRLAEIAWGHLNYVYEGNL